MRDVEQRLGGDAAAQVEDVAGGRGAPSRAKVLQMEKATAMFSFSSVFRTFFLPVVNLVAVVEGELHHTVAVEVK